MARVVCLGLSVSGSAKFGPVLEPFWSEVVDVISEDLFDSTGVSVLQLRIARHTREASLVAQRHVELSSGSFIDRTLNGNDRHHVLKGARNGAVRLQAPWTSPERGGERARTSLATAAGNRT